MGHLNKQKASCSIIEVVFLNIIILCLKKLSGGFIMNTWTVFIKLYFITQMKMQFFVYFCGEWSLLNDSHRVSHEFML